MVIHTREAWEDTLALLRGAGPGGGIMHCFTGDERAGARGARPGIPPELSAAC